jgi:hypothetical protein
MFKITNSINLVKALFSKTDPTRVHGNNKIQPKIRILLPSSELKSPNNEEKHMKLEISFAKQLEML